MFFVFCLLVYPKHCDNPESQTIWVKTEFQPLVPKTALHQMTKRQVTPKTHLASVANFLVYNDCCDFKVRCVAA